MPNGAPCGSMSAAKRPPFGSAVVGVCTLAPKRVAASTVASTSIVPMYGSQCGVVARVSTVPPIGPFGPANIR